MTTTKYRPMKILLNKDMKMDSSPINILKVKKIDLRKIDMICEKYKNFFIEINIYTFNNYFAYEYKIKIEKIIKQKSPHADDFIYTTKDAAIFSAKKEIRENCKQSRKAQRTIENFKIINYNQLELF